MSAETKSQGHIGSLLVSTFMATAGIVTLYDTTGYSDRDSQVFPQTVAIILIITAGISLVQRFLTPSEEGGFGDGSWWRRCLLVVGMLGACAAIPYIGFLAAGAIGFFAGLIAAMHDRWSVTTFLVYGGFGGAVLVAFFALFKFVLRVPLP